MQRRRVLRLKHYEDATLGAYFVTIVTQDRLPLFGEIVHGEMHLNDAGRMVDAKIEEIPAHYPGFSVDVFVVMPNHVHVILEINDRVGAGPRARPFPAGQPQGVAPTQLPLGEMVARLKSLTTNAYIRAIKTHNWPAFHHRLWQRNYHEHVMRNERDRNALREYVACNPNAWPNGPANPHL